MTARVVIQVANWRTAEVQLLNPDKSEIDLTGATGYFVWISPNDTSYRIALTLGRAESVDQAAEAEAGWCWATFKGIDLEGQWSEQVQAILPTGSEPLNGEVVEFNVFGNLSPP